MTPQLAGVRVRQRVQLSQVAVPHHQRIGRDLHRVLEITEAYRAAEGECQLVRIEKLEHDDVVTSRTQVPEPPDDARRIVEQVGNDNHYAPLQQRLGELAQWPC